MFTGELASYLTGKNKMPYINEHKID